MDFLLATLKGRGWQENICKLPRDDYTQPTCHSLLFQKVHFYVHRGSEFITYIFYLKKKIEKVPLKQLSQTRDSS